MPSSNWNVRRIPLSVEECQKVVNELEESLTYSERESGPYSRESQRLKQELAVARRRLDAATREQKTRDDQAKLSPTEIVDRTMGR
jgi:hypothetical protein